MEKKPGEMRLINGNGQIQNKKTGPVIRQARLLNIKANVCGLGSQF